MPGGFFEDSAREKLRTAVNKENFVWCPFCDDWALTDSIVARKRLGLHIANYHADEVLFHKEERPPKLESV